MNEIASGAKIKQRSPTDASMPLSSALPWKVWVKIEGNPYNINQPISIQFNEMDTIDDLKTKLLERLNPSRWSQFVDNTSIAIGIYGTSTELDETPISATSPIETDSFLNRSRRFLPPESTPSPPFSFDKPSNMNPTNTASTIGSPHRSRSNSSGIAAVIPRSPLVRYSSILPYCNLHSYQQSRSEFSNVPMPLSTSLNTARGRHISIYKKPFKMITERDALDPNTEQQQIIFEPDALVVNIYADLFGYMGSQRSSEALSVIANNYEDSYIPATPLETINVATFIPTNEEIARQILESDEPNGKDDEFSLHTPPPPDLNIVDEPEAPQLLNSQSEQEETGREFKFITDEEQLLKESQSFKDTEQSSEHPKPAILLLPKGYTGDVDFSENSPKDDSAPFPASQVSTPKASAKPELTLTIPPYAPLDENEVGLIHPLLESERHKMEASPVSFKELGNEKSRPPTSEFGPHTQIPDRTTNSTSTNTKVFPNITVLIVEDNVINQTILCSFLRKHKISYKVAKNGQEAVEKWQEGDIDLIFMDLQLPILSGTEAAKQIRDLEKKKGSSKVESDKPTKKAPVIIVAFTASDSQSVKSNALLSGCNDYLTKPVNLHWLSKKINEWGCMQALIDFDAWKEGQSRMTERLSMKKSPKIPVKPEMKHSSSSHRIRSSSNGSSQSKLSETKNRPKLHSRKPTGTGITCEKC